VLGADAVQLARVDRTGIYQLGGATDDVVWRVGVAPDINGLSPRLDGGAVHLVYLRARDQVFARTALSAVNSTHLGMWLVWPDAP